MSVAHSNALYFLAPDTACHSSPTYRTLSPLKPPCGLCLFSFKLSCTFNSIPLGLTRARPSFCAFSLSDSSSWAVLEKVMLQGRAVQDKFKTAIFQQALSRPDDLPSLLCSLSHIISNLFHSLNLYLPLSIPCYIHLVDFTSHFTETSESPQLSTALINPSLPLV